MRAVLTYHSLDDSGSAISVSPEAFRQHIRWLASGRVRVVSLQDLIALPPGEDAVALTFDDGFRSVAEVAAPLLADHGFPATVFVVTGHVGGDNAWTGSRTGNAGIPVLPLMTWDQLARLRELGVTLGAHTRTHPSLPACPRDRLLEELEGAAADLAGVTGTAPDTFAYPYGEVTPAVGEEVRRRFAVACTTRLAALPGSEHLDPVRVPRLDMYYFRRADRLGGWGSPAFRSRLWVRRTLRGMRRVVVGGRA